MQRIVQPFTVVCICIPKFERTLTPLSLKLRPPLNTPLPPRMVADALWLLTARSRGGNHWVSNVHSDIESVDIAGHSYPVTLLNNSDWQESYVASPRSTWLRYARQEAIRHVAPGFAGIMKAASCLIFGPLSALMHASKLDEAAIIGNYLISTNLYPQWNARDIADLTDNMRQRHTDRPLMIRNICPEVSPELTDNLTAQGWKMLPSRMIYLCDPQQKTVWKHNHVKQDVKLLADGQVDIVHQEHLKSCDLHDLRDVFRQLFIDKHSHLNPDFSPAFFELCLETGFLELIGLRWQGRWVGILGLYVHPESGWITTPLIGYDTSLPQELGLYRRLMALLLQQAKERECRLHYSSGASQFKRARGGVPALEYTAVYDDHLPKQQKKYSGIFIKLFQQCAPGMLKRADQL